MSSAPGSLGPIGWGARPRRAILLVLGLGLLCGQLCAQLPGSPSLTIYTEEDPPYAFAGKDGRPAGFAVELVAELERRLGLREPITLVPWARGYNEALTRPNVLLFTMARTREREPHFNWIGPIMDNRWIVVALREAPPRIESLEDLRRLPALAVANQVVWDNYLTAQGFTNLTRAVSTADCIKLLAAGRVAAYVTKDLGFDDEIISGGLDPGDFVEVFTINTVQLYIAISKGSDPGIVARWQGAFEGLVADGGFRAIHQRWFPGRKPPGPAQVPRF